MVELYIQMERFAPAIDDFMVNPVFTDFYDLTMAYRYWKAGRAEELAVFELFFRKCPFGGKVRVVLRGLVFSECGT